MPRCRTMIVPACTAWPSPALMPSRWLTLSRPFLTEPPAFLCAIDRSRPYFCVFFGAALFVPLAFRAAGRALSPVPVVSAFAVRPDGFAAVALSAFALELAFVAALAAVFLPLSAVALS